MTVCGFHACLKGTRKKIKISQNWKSSHYVWFSLFSYFYFLKTIQIKVQHISMEEKKEKASFSHKKLQKDLNSASSVLNLGFDLLMNECLKSFPTSNKAQSLGLNTIAFQLEFEYMKYFVVWAGEMTTQNNFNIILCSEATLIPFK